MGGDTGLYECTFNRQAVNALIRIFHSLGRSAGILLSGVDSFCPCLLGVMLESANSSGLAGDSQPKPERQKI